MNQELQKESPLSTKPQGSLKISARTAKIMLPRISQGDIFENIKVIERLKVDKSQIYVDYIEFPYVVCMNQECDLENDYNRKDDKLFRDSYLLHLCVAPAFSFSQYLSGNHWGSIFSTNKAQKTSDTIIRKVMDNEIPRFHFLKFPETDKPELIIDFKHFFTINREEMYSQIGMRMCSIDDLYKEKINQRFAFYQSRIGLPE